MFIYKPTITNQSLKSREIFTKEEQEQKCTSACGNNEDWTPKDR